MYKLIQLMAWSSLSRYHLKVFWIHLKVGLSRNVWHSFGFTVKPALLSLGIPIPKGCHSIYGR